MSEPVTNPSLAIYRYDTASENMNFLELNIADAVNHLFPSLAQAPESADRSSTSEDCRSRTWQYVSSIEYQKYTWLPLVDAYNWISYQVTSQDARRPHDRELVISGDDCVVTHHYLDDTYEVFAKNDHESRAREALDIETKFYFLRKRVALKCEGTMQERLEAYNNKVKETVEKFDIHQVDVQFLPHLRDFVLLDLDDMKGEVPDSIQKLSFLKRIYHKHVQLESLKEIKDVHLIQMDDTPTPTSDLVQEVAEPKTEEADPFEGVDFHDRQSIIKFIRDKGLDLGQCRGAYYIACGRQQWEGDWVDANFTAYPENWKAVLQEKLNSQHTIRRTQTTKS